MVTIRGFCCCLLVFFLFFIVFCCFECGHFVPLSRLIFTSLPPLLTCVYADLIVFVCVLFGFVDVVDFVGFVGFVVCFL